MRVERPVAREATKGLKAARWRSVSACVLLAQHGTPAGTVCSQGRSHGRFPAGPLESRAAQPPSALNQGEPVDFRASNRRATRKQLITCQYPSLFASALSFDRNRPESKKSARDTEGLDAKAVVQLYIYM